ncbi:MAG TPA: hypothetical protein VEA41_09685 [Salinarimonas sp.]|jgi:hypothetical protein|nr:hypothetical protein [Salinarimonas sp.]
MIRAIVAAGIVAGLAGCTTAPGREGGGSVLGNLFMYGGTTVPPAAPRVVEDIDCPSVDVSDAAIRSYAGGRQGQYEALRHQISIANVARECAVQDDGSIRVRVGVQGRVLIGPAGGSGGRFDAPVTVVVRSNAAVFASRARRVAVSVPAGETGADFTAVEDAITVPASVGDNFEILVGLGTQAAAPRQARRR